MQNVAISSLPPSLPTSLAVQHAGGASSLCGPARPHSHPISDPSQRDFCEPLFLPDLKSPLDNQSLICLCLSSNRHCMMCLGGPRQVTSSQMPNKPLNAKHEQAPQENKWATFPDKRTGAQPQKRSNSGGCLTLGASMIEGGCGRQAAIGRDVTRIDPQTLGSDSLGSISATQPGTMGPPREIERAFSDGEIWSGSLLSFFLRPQINDHVYCIT